jgi:hypothetical protein
VEESTNGLNELASHGADTTTEEKKSALYHRILNCQHHKKETYRLDMIVIPFCFFRHFFSGAPHNYSLTIVSLQAKGIEFL